ncbi:hypothetical protein SDC9_180771 [bioreactor metagenome]|uniref:YopX protein domain-containing protein n=1 Tax=bioreactor metagenome TaxID=1076179 RepID=A0A645H471_9ZZZZ
MNLIRFRGKRLRDGTWTYGWLVIELDGTAWISKFHRRGEWEQVWPETVGQYIGQKNKNGQEIYTGDILSGARYPLENYNILMAKNDKPPHNFIWGYIVKPDANVRGISHNIFQTLDTDNECSQLETIGNIHDNPELVGGTP